MDKKSLSERQLAAACMGSAKSEAKSKAARQNGKLGGRVSLADKLSEAADLSELHALLAIGKEYLWASDRTRRKWNRVAKLRRSQLLKADKQQKKGKP